METDFNNFIHACRSLLIAELPRNAEVVLSAGCSGKWYFDWFEECYGRVGTHIGLELYSPKPDMLPNNVKWIPNSVSCMSNIPGDSVDILFSGQNVEHLFRDDLRGFFLEASRVLKPGGILCIDSPNRNVTVPCKYIQPEHVLELSPREASALMKLSGFTVDKEYGILDCRESLNNSGSVDSSLTPSTPVAYAKSADDCFIWWIVATKSGSPNVQAFEERIDSLFLREYPLFISSRFKKTVGSISGAPSTLPILNVKHAESGYPLYGPYIPLPPGRYSAYFNVRASGPVDEQGNIRFDVVSHGGRLIHAEKKMVRRQLTDKLDIIRLDFALKSYTAGLETRIYSEGLSLDVAFRSEIVPV